MKLRPESELLAQAAVLAAAYRTDWLQNAPTGALEVMPKPQLHWARQAEFESGERWTPLVPQLDLAETPILPRAPDALAVAQPAVLGALLRQLARVSDLRRRAAALVEELGAATRRIDRLKQVGDRFKYVLSLRQKLRINFCLPP